MSLAHQLLLTGVLGSAAGALVDTESPVAWDDFHYPNEEAAEMADVVPPTACANANGWSVVFEAAVPSGAAFASGLSAPAGLCVLERSFKQWGVMALLGSSAQPAPGSKARLLRKSVGELAGINQPRFNFTAEYYNKSSAFEDLGGSLTDHLSELAIQKRNAAGFIDGELSFGALAQVLPPARDVTEISLPSDVVKFVVSHSGRIKCSAGTQIAELENLSEPPAAQKVVFDPKRVLSYWPNGPFDHMKSGLVGGHLRIANVGAYSKGSGGFELVAVADASFHAVTKERRSAEEQREDRAEWRMPSINYSPAVYVRVREQTAVSSSSGFRYWRASNSSLQNVSATQFYENLETFMAHSDASFDRPVAKVRLPGPEGQRQRDQALSGMLLASNNYVGNQSNYGNGQIYWSYGRQDNGSLALIPITVEDALLDYGLCDTARGHIGYYFDYYLTADGEIKYPQNTNWKTWVDSVGDIGRLASLFLKARRICGTGSAQGEVWGRKHEPQLLALGRRMLELKAAGTDGRLPPRGAPRPESAGLVAGSPEADWSHFKQNVSRDNETWYNVNVWLQRGMAEIADSLPEGDSLGQQLHGNASLFATQIAASVAASLVPANASGFAHPPFLPPYARARGEFPVWRNMTQKALPAPWVNADPYGVASYSNFRFWPEMVISDTLPRDVEGAYLSWHNEMGGRLGGASRFYDHLDDFPSAGWAYGALTHNRTEDFLALLYGHMATFCSHGTFHATEQLSFLGGDAYRDYNGKWGTCCGIDVSLDVVPAIEVARLTRWQLLFEPYRHDNGLQQVWLGRGAPTRWFRSEEGFGASGFTLSGAGGGRLSFDVSTAPASQTATYTVKVVGVGGTILQPGRFVLRWPGALQEGSMGANVNVTGCTVVQTEQGNGLVVVQPTWGGAAPLHSASFSVTASWEQ